MTISGKSLDSRPFRPGRQHESVTVQAEEPSPPREGRARENLVLMGGKRHENHGCIRLVVQGCKPLVCTGSDKKGRSFRWLVAVDPDREPRCFGAYPLQCLRVIVNGEKHRPPPRLAEVAQSDVNTDRVRDVFSYFNWVGSLREW